MMVYHTKRYITYCRVPKSSCWTYSIFFGGGNSAIQMKETIIILVPKSGSICKLMEKKRLTWLLEKEDMLPHINMVQQSSLTSKRQYYLEAWHTHEAVWYCFKSITYLFTKLPCQQAVQSAGGEQVLKAGITAGRGPARACPKCDSAIAINDIVKVLPCAVSRSLYVDDFTLYCACGSLQDV